ncbi:hypothetical protein DL93DRAFT_1320383 [Clavulina sp. PMI_390]|nr:hypothetical protein DL93DRAFT_1320383 [Clavulina sp. PMI_390]
MFDPVIMPVQDIGRRAPFLYYQLFQNGQPISSLQSFDKDYSALGRVRRISIAPPQTVSVFHAYIATLEGFQGNDIVQIYLPDSYAPAAPNTRLQLAAGAPGTTPDEPIALIVRDSPPPPWRLDISGVGIPTRDPADPSTVISGALPPKWRAGYAARDTYLLDWEAESLSHIGRRTIKKKDLLWVRLDASRQLSTGETTSSCHQVIHVPTRRLGAVAKEFIV